MRANAITPPELSGGTFTVSNLGMYGVTDFTAVINPPQAAILAVGALAQRAVVRDGALVARHTMNVTLACDHRILYGADAAQFLARIRALLERPLALAFADERPRRGYCAGRTRSTVVPRPSVVRRSSSATRLRTFCVAAVTGGRSGSVICASASPVSCTLPLMPSPAVRTPSPAVFFGAAGAWA